MTWQKLRALQIGIGIVVYCALAVMLLQMLWPHHATHLSLVHRLSLPMLFASTILEIKDIRALQFVLGIHVSDL